MASRVLGLGRIQPYLDDPDVSDIHVRGCEPVWLKMRDGSRRLAPPVADADDELIDLVRLAAARMGKAAGEWGTMNSKAAPISLKLLLNR